MDLGTLLNSRISSNSDLVDFYRYDTSPANRSLYFFSSRIDALVLWLGLPRNVGQE